MLPRSRALLAFFVGLLVLNLLLSFLTGAPPDRPRVPYQPFFLAQLEAGNVETITSREDSIEGELKKPTMYDPPGDDKPVEVDRFKTQVPAFIDRTELTTVVTDQKVVINARAPDAGRSFLVSLVLGLAPALVLVGLLVWFARRQAGRGGVLGGFGRSTARRLEQGGQQRVTFNDVAGIDEAEQELVGDRRLPQEPGALHPARRPHSPRRAPVRPTGDGQDAARPRGSGGGARGVLLAVGVRVRRGNRRDRRVPRA